MELGAPNSDRLLPERNADTAMQEQEERETEQTEGRVRGRAVLRNGNAGRKGK